MPRITTRARSGRFRRAVPLTAALALAATVVGAPVASGGETDARSGERVYAGMAAQKRGGADHVKLDLLALNDFHGNLDVVPSTSSSGRINNTPAGGAAFLAGLLEEERTASRAAGATPITVAAGDLIGASPLLSAAFHDEPSIKALNRMGLEVAAVGNHEFDEGWRELLRMQRGGCIEDGDGADGQNSCPGRQGFNGAGFQYLGANVKWEDPSRRKRDTLLPATKIMKVDGVKVGFIGMTLEGTDAIVAQAGIQGIEFADEVETANALVPQLRRRGVESIIVLLHEGGTPSDATAYNDCPGLSGPGLTIAQDLKPAIDAVVSGHTHQPYNCVVKDPRGNNRLLTSAASFGRMVTKMHFLIDRRTGDVVRPAAYARNRIVRNDGSIAPDTAIQRLIEVYTRLVAPIANEVIGQIAPAGDVNSITRDADANGQDSALGNLIADAQKADETIVQGDQAPVVALMNPGGIRADLVENDQGDITYGAAFSVQPFNNFVTSMDLTGAQITDILNQQWNGGNAGGQKILQVSGLSYTWDLSEAEAADADALVGDVMIDADGDPGTPMVPLEDGTTYRVVANNFLADGGDSFPGFLEGTNRLVGGLDIDSLRAYLLANSPVEETPTDRISQQP